MQAGVTVLNFDGTYSLQPSFHPPACEWLDLTDLQETKGYCSPASLQTIAERLRGRRQRGVTLLGSGSYHYVTLLLLSEVREPFTLVVFDRHADFLAPLAAGVVSCGSWCRTALATLPLLRKVVLLGAAPEARLLVPEALRAKVAVFTDRTLRRLSRQAVLSAVPTKAVYLSIDKDVLDVQDMVTDWGSGRLPLAHAADLVACLANHRRIAGMDLCGEPPFSPADALRPEAVAAARRSEEANRRLIAAAAGRLGGHRPPAS